MKKIFGSIIFLFIIIIVILFDNYNKRYFIIKKLNELKISSQFNIKNLDYGKKNTTYFLEKSVLRYSYKDDFVDVKIIIDYFDNIIREIAIKYKTNYESKFDDDYYFKIRDKIIRYSNIELKLKKNKNEYKWIACYGGYEYKGQSIEIITDMNGRIEYFYNNILSDNIPKNTKVKKTKQEALSIVIKILREKEGIVNEKINKDEIELKIFFANGRWYNSFSYYIYQLYTKFKYMPLFYFYEKKLYYQNLYYIVRCEIPDQYMYIDVLVDPVTGDIVGGFDVGGYRGN